MSILAIKIDGSKALQEQYETENSCEWEGCE